MPSRSVKISCLSAGFMFSAVAFSTVQALAAPGDDLLDRAVREQQAVSGEDPAAAESLVSKADQLVRDKKFDEAVELYERAYRMNPNDRSGYAKMLMVKQAVGSLTESEREALLLIEEEHALRIDESIRLIRLDVLQARQAIAAGDVALAQSKVGHARDLMDRLPPNVDVSIYRTEVGKLAQQTGFMARRAAKDSPARADDIGDDIAEDDDGAMMDEDFVAPLRKANLLAERYEPDGRIVNPDWYRLETWDDDFYKYQSDLEYSIRASRGNWYLGVEAAKLAPRDEGLVYPADWGERSATRANFRYGEIYRGPTRLSESGEEYYTAIYDLGDLVHPTPDFPGMVDPDSLRQLQATLDRDWIRRRSLMFGGYASDLAAGVGVLPYYGGINNWAVSPRTDTVELERVLRTIDRFFGTPRNPQQNQPDPNR